VRGHKQKTAGKGQERESMSKSPKVKKESSKREREEARTSEERIPELEDPQVEAKKEIKARKWIRKWKPRLER
jgi:hypothetical protein